ncbi:unnamed protein product [Bursaphelenchus okinawaensis]|uniref:Uncharacterized protein n=1 Tax=Bursaphelenchus okinawaensis TaxID=465554 RepID=A0A811KW25_9BILA|nr:unnamed protein product [Bursaphelenchus okinawaensis]CAG9113137.1 unnamed protein product [Bursaphelenchus okinawaensis]
MSLLKTIALLLVLSLCVDSLIIYRRKPKPRLICHEEYEDEVSSESSSDGDNDSDDPLTTTAVRVTKAKQTRTKRDNEKIKIRFDERVRKRALDADDFEIIGESLSESEKEAIKRKLVQTCQSLSIP